jgi:hypothetical protein
LGDAVVPTSTSLAIVGLSVGMVGDGFVATGAGSTTTTTPMATIGTA